MTSMQLTAQNVKNINKAENKLVQEKREKGEVKGALKLS